MIKWMQNYSVCLLHEIPEWNTYLIFLFVNGKLLESVGRKGIGLNPIGHGDGPAERSIILKLLIL